MFSVKRNVLETVGLLKAYGINEIVLSPGSRNAPLIQTFSSDPFFSCHVIVDERNAAFYALGIIQFTQKPVVVCCTSGSALLNYAPAVSEAYYQQLPLIVVSADRSMEWIGQMDGQTIPQYGVFGVLSKKSVQLPEVYSDLDLWFCNRLLNEALIAATADIEGPVHINVPVSEPLFDYSVTELPLVRKIRYARPMKVVDVVSYVEVLRNTSKALVIVGQGFYDKELIGLLQSLVEKISCVVIVEHLSNTSSDLFVPNADTLLSVVDEFVKGELKPDVVISIGGHIVSKKLKHFIRQYKPAYHWFVSERSDVVDLYESLTDLVETDSNIFIKGILEKIEAKETSEFYNTWKSLSDKICEPVDVHFSDILVTGTFLNKLPVASYLHLANSSVVRNAQLFKIESSIRVFCDRGTNGIESSLPSAIGFASVSDSPVFLAIGDLSFFYTVGSLWNIQHIKNLRILLINNRSGGIFHLLPGLDDASSLKQYVAAEHNCSAQRWVEASGIDYISAKNKTELDEALDILISHKNDRSILLEVFTDIEISKQISKEYYNKLKTIIYNGCS